MIICFRDALQQENKNRQATKGIDSRRLKESCWCSCLDGKPVNAVARENGVTLMTLEQYFRKSELLQTPSVDQFIPQLKFSQMKKREFCPIIFYVRQNFTTAYLGKQPSPSKNMSKLILTDYMY